MQPSEFQDFQSEHSKTLSIGQEGQKRYMLRKVTLYNGIFDTWIPYIGILFDDTSHICYIIGKKLLSLKPVVRTRRSCKRAGLIKRQKSFQGLAMYGHEVFDVLTKASKVIRDTLFE
jgi:hypothetical protein